MKFFDFLRRKAATGNTQPPPPPTVAVAPAPETKTLPNGVTLSPALSARYDHILKTALPFIEIKAVPDNNLSLTQSKFGGKPYWPASRPYPTDTKGAPMFLLAQLNFSEIPFLRGYPEAGILQFYVAADDVYGLNFDDRTQQAGFRVVYFETIDEATAEQAFPFLDGADFEYVPVNRPMALRFSRQTDYVGSWDVRFAENFGKSVQAFAQEFGEAEDAVGDELWESFPSNGHRIGGYAFFTQDDPRRYKDAHKDWVLLLQIDSDDNIVWGDAGVANFFIHPEDLQRRDFSRVLYNWDCS